MWEHLSKMKLRVDVQRLVDRYGGDLALSKYMTENGHSISRQAIHQARRNGLLSMNLWLALCEIEKAKGQKLDLWFYIKEAR